MTLFTPSRGAGSLQSHVTATTNETATFAISVTAHASANTIGAWVELIAATTYESGGIMVQLAGLQTTATTNQRCLVDIGIGAAGSEVVIIPTLTCGNVADFGAASATGVSYFFPLHIPSGVRIAARCQASTGGDIVNVAVRVYQSSFGRWEGARVTAYGADAANSRGTSHTPTANSYSAATQLTASTTNPIRYMQVGFDLLSDTTATTSNHLIRIGYGAGPTYLVSELPLSVSTTIEAVQFTHANFILSHMRFNLPAEQSLHVAAMRTASTPEARGYIVYGCD
jgi:hypothetical protein